MAANPRYCKFCGNEIGYAGGNRLRAMYCDKVCKFADPELRKKIGTRPNAVTKTCPVCGKDFQVNVSMAHRYIRCSKACSSTRRVDVNCQRCGKTFRRCRTEVRLHCSEVCRRPPSIVKCQHCAKEFRTTPTESVGRRYCSRLCYRSSDAETSIERIVREALDGLLLGYEQEARVQRWVVDFIVGGRIAIEADGDYWHAQRPDADRRKTAALVKRGYEVWRLPETDIVAPDFAHAFRQRIAEFEATHGKLPQADLLQLARPLRRKSVAAAKPWPPPGVARGERAPTARLTSADVLAIREAAQFTTQTALARQYNVGISTIGSVVYHRSWAHVGGPKLERPTYPPAVPLQRSGPLTKAERDAIRTSTARGTDLAQEYGVSPQTICTVRLGHLWPSQQRSTPNRS